MTTDTAPDLALYHLVHRAMRGDALRLADAVASTRAGDRRRAAAFVRWFRGYAGEIHDHHAIEDDHFFPALAARVPGYGEHAGRVVAEHEHLVALLERGEAALRVLADGSEPWDLAHEGAIQATRALADLIDSHLAFEDEQILPLFVEHLTAAEYRELEEQATAKPDFLQVVFTVPWALDWASDEERRHALASAPAVMSLVWRLRRRPYARLASVVFGRTPRPVAHLPVAA